MLVNLLILILGALLAFHLYKAGRYTVLEGAGNYSDYDADEKSCMTLASQNEENITWLKSQIENVTNVGNQLSALQQQSDNNKSTLSSLVDNQTTVSGVPTDTTDS
jgi:hypothetical protein